MNWYKTQKEADIKNTLKNIAKPALLMAPLGVGLGFLGNNTNKTETKEPTPIVKNETPTTQIAPTTQNQISQELTNMIKNHEGYSEKVYMDTQNIPTIGIGYNLNKPGAKEKIQSLGYDYEKVVAGTQTINKDSVIKLFNEDVQTAMKDAESVIPNFSSHPESVKNVIIDMVFNLGINRFKGFTKMIEAVNAKNYTKAADEMVNSKWYSQVKNRGKELANMMRLAS